MLNKTLNSTLNHIHTSIINQSMNPSESSFLFYFKLFSFICILMITFSFGLLPIFFARYRQTTILNYANPFAGGIFIGIGLFHLLPDASYDFDQYYKTKKGSHSFFYGFPMSYFIAFLSYSFILYLEKVAFSIKDKKDENNIENNIDEEIIELLLKEENDDENNNNKEIKEEGDNNIEKNKGKILFIYLNNFIKYRNNYKKKNKEKQ